MSKWDNTTCKPLTYESFKKFRDYMLSPKRHEEYMERMRKEAKMDAAMLEAYDFDRMVKENFGLYRAVVWSRQMNGFWLVSPAIKDEMEKYRRDGDQLTQPVK